MDGILDSKSVLVISYIKRPRLVVLTDTAARMLNDYVKESNQGTWAHCIHSTNFMVTWEYKKSNLANFFKSPCKKGPCKKVDVKKFM
jgi:hypothetical protein